MSIRFQAGFEAIAFESTKPANWKPKKKNQLMALISLFKSTMRVKKMSF